MPAHLRPNAACVPRRQGPEVAAGSCQLPRIALIPVHPTSPSCALQVHDEGELSGPARSQRFQGAVRASPEPGHSGSRAALPWAVGFSAHRAASCHMQPPFLGVCMQMFMGKGGGPQPAKDAKVGCAPERVLAGCRWCT